MEYLGDEPGTDWETHVIKFGEGTTPPEHYFGEKWERARFFDIDFDGDLDIVAAEEEIWTNSLPWFDPDAGKSQIGAVWFENEINTNPPAASSRQTVTTTGVVAALLFTVADWVLRHAYVLAIIPVLIIGRKLALGYAATRWSKWLGRLHELPEEQVVSRRLQQD